MTRPAPWTIAVADRANPANPSIAYVTNASDRDDAIARVQAHHAVSWTGATRACPAAVT